MTGLSLEYIKKSLKRKVKVEKLAALIIQDPSIIKELVDAVKVKEGTFKFNCEKILRMLSEKDPRLIYPYFDEFVKMLDSENNLIKWGSIITIVNLTSVDNENKFDEIFDKFFHPVKGPVMITASNIVKYSGKIALAKPELADRIACEILKIRNGQYFNRGEISPECKNIVCGHAIDSFSMYFGKISNKIPVIDFVKEQLINSRPAVAKKADKFLKKYNI